jgi:hypothetical protein
MKEDELREQVAQMMADAVIAPLSELLTTADAIIAMVREADVMRGGPGEGR